MRLYMKISKGQAIKFVLVAGCILCLTSVAAAQTPSVQQAAGNDELLKLMETEYTSGGVKDQFESKDAFNKRIHEYADRQFLITVGLGTYTTRYREHKAFSYNAETQTLTVTLVGDSSLDIIRLMERLSEEEKRLGPRIMLNGKYTKFTLVSSGPELEREYLSQNALGATVTISVYRSKYRGIAILNVPEALGPPLMSVQVKMAPEVARALSKRAQWKLSIRPAMLPGQKSLVVDDGAYYGPTLKSPTESYTDGKTMTVSIMRAALVDPETNAVIAEFRFKQDGQSATPQPSSGHATLGVQISPVSDAIAAALSLPNSDGALVVKVVPGSAAEKAGIKPGDVLLMVAGKRIKNAPDVTAALVNVPPGSTANITLIRTGKESEISVKF